MNGRRTRTFGGLAALATIALAVAGGVAYATIPTATGQIHGCFNPGAADKNGGTELKIVDSDAASCGKGQREVVWNQEGPQGEPGPAGPPGEKGDPGAPGGGGVLYTLSQSYPEYEVVHITFEPKVVASLDVPAGTYLVNADVVFAGDSLFCSIGQEGAADAGSTGRLQFFDWVTLSQDGAIEIWCERGGLSTGIQSVSSRRVAALEVAIA